MIFFLFFLLLFSKDLYSQYLRTGDLIFQNLDCGEFCEAINAVTPAYKGKNFNHVGIIAIIDQKPYVFEAISKGVVFTPLEEAIKRCSEEDTYFAQIDDDNCELPSIDAMKSYLNKPYDEVFDIENDKYYCSELVYLLYKQKDGMPFFRLSPMTFKVPNTNNFFPIWVEYFKKLNISIPEGKPGINPGQILNHPSLKVFRFDEMFE